MPNFNRVSFLYVCERETCACDDDDDNDNDDDDKLIKILKKKKGEVLER